jgi:hypothetical protein
MQVRRALTTFKRYRSGRGFGIHSPFAFSFVLEVLRERTAYYSYAKLRKIHKHLRKVHAHHIMSYKYMKMLFRVTNYFQPEHILAIGALHGEAAASMLEVSCSSRITILHPSMTLDSEIISEYAHRISIENEIGSGVAKYFTEEHNPTFVYISDIDNENKDAIIRAIKTAIEHNGIVIIRHLGSKIAREVWKESRRGMSYGMTFTNDRDLAVIVARPHLPKQNYKIWL